LLIKVLPIGSTFIFLFGQLNYHNLPFMIFSLNLRLSKYGKAIQVFSLLGLILLSGCTYDKQAEPIPLTPSDTLATVSYSKVIKPILQANCYTCHSDTSKNPEKPGYAFFNNFNELRNDYALKTSPSNTSYTKLIARLRGIETPRMPFKRDPLNDSLIVKIETWIKQGAKEN
jgi:hypothetical protein